jgi:hypothetical protein
MAVVDRGAAYWDDLRNWGADREDFFSAREKTVLLLAADIPRRFPSFKQCRLLLDAEERAKREGF